jgi:parallel beta-helix repeat protein
MNVNKMTFEKKKENKYLSILMVLILSVLSFSEVTQTVSIGMVHSTPTPSNGGNHATITITYDIWLDEFCAGNGTDGSALNPHVIEDLTIDGGGGDYGIHIWGISKYLIIRNCTVVNARNGISITKTNNVIISNNTASGGAAGFYFREAVNLTVTDNTASTCSFGFFVYEVNNSIISDNTAMNSLKNGIKLLDSNGNEVYGNKACQSSEDNILEENSSNNLHDNDCCGDCSTPTTSTTDDEDSSTISGYPTLSLGIMVALTIIIYLKKWKFRARVSLS